MAYTGYVSRVIDGDTFETRTETIRIADIDAPESNTTAGKNATAYLKSLIEYKTVLLESKGKDYFGRTIATVWRQSDHLNIGNEMVRAGHAKRKSY